MRRLWIVIFCLGCIACAPVHIRTTDETGVVPKPPKNKALIVFLRPSSYTNAVYRFYDGDKLIGVLERETYFYLEVSPGKHSFGAVSNTQYPKSANYDFLEGDLLPGKTYYILARPINAFIKLLVFLEPITPGSEYWQNLDRWLAKCKRAEMIDSAYSWEEQNSGQIQKLREETRKELAIKPDTKSIRPQDGV
jgi:hypothetical protein